jgi:Flp pilus assembly pilin Flp
MTRIARTFLKNDDGAVTVDFVVLTAGVIGLCMLFILPVLAESVSWGEAIAVLAQRSLNE